MQKMNAYVYNMNKKYEVGKKRRKKNHRRISDTNMNCAK